MKNGIDRVKVKNNLTEKGMTLAGWCRLNGFNRISVYQLMAGSWGTKSGSQAGSVAQSIIAQLNKDHLLDA